MKTVIKLLIAVFAFLALTAIAYAQSPREELQLMVEQLQKTPADTALRKQIIALAQELKPAPAIPEQAREPFVIGSTVLKKSSDPAGVNKAVDLFTQALNIAPWFADAYYNRAIAHETAGQFDAAIDDLKTYLDFKITDSERREVQDKIYSLKADVQLASAKIPSLVGNWKVFVNGFPQKAGDDTGRGSTWFADFHYRFEVLENEVVAYLVVDSDPDIDKTWCRRAGGKWACKGDEDLFGRFSVDKNMLQGRCEWNNYNSNLRGTLSRSEIQWEWGLRIGEKTFPQHETLRKQE